MHVRLPYTWTLAVLAATAWSSLFANMVGEFAWSDGNRTDQIEFGWPLKYAGREESPEVWSDDMVDTWIYQRTFVGSRRDFDWVSYPKALANLIVCISITILATSFVEGCCRRNSQMRNFNVATLFAITGAVATLVAVGLDNTRVDIWLLNNVIWLSRVGLIGAVFLAWFGLIKTMMCFFRKLVSARST